MRSYVPNTVEERREMLKTLGLSEMDELLSSTASWIFPLR